MRLPAGDMRRALLANDHFEALGISRSASSADAKKAFHKLALKLHPDKNKMELAEEAFKRIEEAHRTLSDPSERERYELSLPDGPPRPSRAHSRSQPQYYNSSSAFQRGEAPGFNGRPAQAGKGRKWE